MYRRKVAPRKKSRWEKWVECRASAKIPDDHLFLGVTLDAIMRFKNLTTFPRGYSRQKYFEDSNREDWITPKYGSGLIGYDFVHSIRQWHNANNLSECSAAEYLKMTGDAGVQSPVIFVSHVQSESLEDTLRVTRSYIWRRAEKLYREVPCWLDYLILRQCKNDFNPLHISSVIESIAWTVAVEDSKET
eukprot:TRINITY_DN23811_c0_g1_i1.p1 TRINITY_DN23811_c0_g1~~TRINITY_DN23811_c0_g1_i1.p1  ORF type:complete len:189 (+),score=10.92 TRINITY_DN23811_c0_g1_i1:70-636(+)